MSESQSQPDTGGQEAAQTPVQNNLGKSFDEYSIAEFLKNNFLNEEGAAPAKEEQQTEPEAEEATTEESSDVQSEAKEEVDQTVEEEEVEETQLSKGVQKRINKLVAAKKAAQAELEAHKERLNQLSKELEEAKTSTVQRPTTTDEYVESIDSLPNLEKEYQKTIEYILWCEENPDGGTIILPDGSERELSDKEVRTAKTAFLRRRDIELPARFNYLKSQEMFSQSASNDFPWWNKPESDEYQAAQFVLKEFPELKRKRADWKHIAGLVVLGMKAYNDLKAKKATPAPAIKRAPSQPSVKAPPAQQKPESNKAQKAFLSDPSNRDSLSNLLKAQGFV